MPRATTRNMFALAVAFSLAACAGRTAPATDQSATRTSEDKNPVVSISSTGGHTRHQGDSIFISIGIDPDHPADSIILYTDNRRFGPIHSTGDTIPTSMHTPVGPMTIRATAYAGAKEYHRTTTVILLPAVTPTRIDFTVKRSYPHDTESYTQGLFWHNGTLYEGTGLYGRSVLAQVNLADGQTIRHSELEEDQFGEGIALFGNSIYQLTWQNGECLVYDAGTLAQTGRFDYTGEGWGLTSDGTQLYMSDGSERITVRDPKTFAARQTIEVYDSEGPVRQLNELEWINGSIWANVYLTNRIVVIDPATGAVTADLDCTALVKMIDQTPSTDVLNGIAYDSQTGRIFLTGKNWNKLFEIETDIK